MRLQRLCVVFIGLVVASAVIGAPAWAGELDPPASALTPQGTPAPTMKPLDAIPPSWDQTLSAVGPLLPDGTPDSCNSPRFKCVMGGEAVLDRETGLVWGRRIDKSTTFWAGAQSACIGYRVGGRGGWRLPTIQELGSVVAFETGHPFLDRTDRSLPYLWSATSNLEEPAKAWVADIFGGAGFLAKTELTAAAWCVRGGSGPDAQ